MSQRPDHGSSGRVIVCGDFTVEVRIDVESLPESGQRVTGTQLTYAAAGCAGEIVRSAAAASAEVRAVGALGGDQAGEAYRAQLAALGIDTRDVVTLAGASPQLFVHRTAAGERSEVEVRSEELDLAWREITPNDVLVTHHGWPGAASAVRYAAGHGARVMWVGPPRGISADVAALTDVIMSEYDAMALADVDVVPRSSLVLFAGGGALWDDLLVTGAATDRHVGAVAGWLAAALSQGTDPASALALALAQAPEVAASEPLW